MYWLRFSFQNQSVLQKLGGLKKIRHFNARLYTQIIHQNYILCICIIINYERISLKICSWILHKYHVFFFFSFNFCQCESCPRYPVNWPGHYGFRHDCCVVVTVPKMSLIDQNSCLSWHQFGISTHASCQRLETLRF